MGAARMLFAWQPRTHSPLMLIAACRRYFARGCGCGCGQAIWGNLNQQSPFAWINLAPSSSSGSDAAEPAAGPGPGDLEAAPARAGMVLYSAALHTELMLHEDKRQKNIFVERVTAALIGDLESAGASPD